jgi:hypothetical protein
LPDFRFYLAWFQGVLLPICPTFLKKNNMLCTFFSLKSRINSVNECLIRNTCLLLLVFQIPFAALAKSEHEFTNNFSNKANWDAKHFEKNPSGIKDFFLYGDFNYQNNIGAVLFSPEDWEMGPPLLRMGAGEKLLLQFDDLDADYKNYYYTIIHCDAYWQPTPLMDYEYIEGFNEDQIRNYSRSINTVVPYTHYWLEFPNQNLSPRLSGNYILKVFVDGNRDNVAFTRRFMVFDQKLNIDGRVRQANLPMYRDTHQQLDFTIDITRYQVSNPYQDLRVVIRQNERWDNAITRIAPRTIQGNRLVYDHETELLFEGGNEFRRFDIRSLRFLTERTAEITSGTRYWDVLLMPDQRRTYRRYTTDNDINGKFYIRTTDFRDDMLEADYAWVHFRLPMDAPVATGSVHVMGQLTNWNLAEDSKMTYNYRLKQYELRLQLKQGYYNYKYVFLEENELKGDVCFFEGCHSVTENEYTIYVYHRAPGELYDRLVGLTNLNTGAARR